MRSDVETIGIGERWYELCQDRKEWFKLCSERVEKVSLSRTKNTCSANNQPQTRALICACGRSFRKREIGLDIRDSVTMLTKVYCHCSWVSPRKPLSCYFVTWVASRFKVQGMCMCACV